MKKPITIQVTPEAAQAITKASKRYKVSVSALGSAIVNSWATSKRPMHMTVKRKVKVTVEKTIRVKP